MNGMDPRAASAIAINIADIVKAETRLASRSPNNECVPGPDSPMFASLTNDAGNILAFIPHGYDAKEQVSVLAAAPELLALAEHISVMADDAYLTGHPEWEEIVKEARAALAKAEGSQ